MTDKGRIDWMERYLIKASIERDHATARVDLAYRSPTTGGACAVSRSSLRLAIQAAIDLSGKEPK